MDASDAAYILSLWAVQKTVLLVLVSAIVGPLFLTDFAAAVPRVHRYLANALGKRKPQIKYQVQDLI